MNQNNYGNIYVQFERNDYGAGDQIDAIVMLNMHQNYPGNVVYIQIDGKESTKLVHYYTTGDSNSTTRHYDSHFGEVELLSDLIPVYQFNSAYIPAGQYSFPISFTLPQGIPSSFEYYFQQHNIDCYALISYMFTAYLPMPTVGVRVPTITFSQPFFVTQNINETQE